LLAGKTQQIAQATIGHHPITIQSDLGDANAKTVKSKLKGAI